MRAKTKKGFLTVASLLPVLLAILLFYSAKQESPQVDAWFTNVHTLTLKPLTTFRPTEDGLHRIEDASLTLNPGGYLILVTSGVGTRDYLPGSTTEIIASKGTEKESVVAIAIDVYANNLDTVSFKGDSAYVQNITSTMTFYANTYDQEQGAALGSLSTLSGSAPAGANHVHIVYQATGNSSDILAEIPLIEMSELVVTFYC